MDILSKVLGGQGISEVRYNLDHNDKISMKHAEAHYYSFVVH